MWRDEYRAAIIAKLRAAEHEHPEMDRFATYMENNQREYIQYSKMRRYTRDIENRYNPGITLTKMVEHYLDLDLESVKTVVERNAQ